MNNRFVQFELWKDCSNGCLFCCNKGQPPVDKAQSLQYISSVLDTFTPNQYDYIGFIGGELFNGEMGGHREEFFQILEKVKQLNPQKIFLATSLLFSLRKYLWAFLIRCRNMEILDKICLCTSWDYRYRFHTPEMYALWSNNMLALGNHFKELELHTEIILTELFLQACIDQEFNLPLFKQVFRTSVDYIEPASGLGYKDKYDCQQHVPDFFPKKATFIKWLQVMKDQIDFNTFLSPELRSDELYYLSGTEHKVAKDRRANNCLVKIADPTIKYDVGFIDSDESMRTVALQYRELLGD